jgi:hypothetical protein
MTLSIVNKSGVARASSTTYVTQSITTPAAGNILVAIHTMRNYAGTGGTHHCVDSTTADWGTPRVSYFANDNWESIAVYEKTADGTETSVTAYDDGGNVQHSLEVFELPSNAVYDNSALNLTKRADTTALTLATSVTPNVAPGIILCSCITNIDGWQVATTSYDIGTLETADAVAGQLEVYTASLNYTDTTAKTLTCTETNSANQRNVVSAIISYKETVPPTDSNVVLDYQTLELVQNSLVNYAGPFQIREVLAQNNVAQTPQANLSNLYWSFFDESSAGSLNAPTVQGTVATTDASGNLVLNVSAGTSTLVPGQQGTLIITNSAGSIIAAYIVTVKNFQ